MSLRLKQVNIVAPDVDASAAFYRLLGVEVGESGGGYESHHRSVEGQPLDMDIDSLAFARSYWADEGIPAGVLLTFGTETREEVDTLYERAVAAGHISLKPPFDAFWGSRYAIVLSPGGEAVGFMSPRDEVYRSTEPDPATFR